VVEVGGAKNLVRSCVHKVSPGMKIVTNSSRVLQARKTVLELLLANHPEDCLSCLRNQTCELQALAEQVGVRRGSYRPTKKFSPPDDAGAAIVRDNTKCILCGRCVAACREIQGVGAIDFMGRGLHTHIGTFMDRPLAQSVCVSCGQCTLVCPTGALTERDESDAVLAAIHDREKLVVVQTAPAIRSSLGEALGMAVGSLVTGSMVAALRRLGFDYVFDTQFAADLTIMEEGTELLHRLSSGGGPSDDHELFPRLD
ncbi:MAG: 4Fe-4S binding protein, partial [Treponemataceae bacterium]|nr:4Fe-4S binding protein [Treponemataceae bacterium]